jgi:CHASE2 domain-containing sensor protein
VTANRTRMTERSTSYFPKCLRDLFYTLIVWLCDLFYALIVWGILHVLMGQVAQSEFGGELKRMLNRFVQERFEGGAREDWGSVVVVDISDLPQEQWREEGRLHSATPRGRLHELMQAAVGAGAKGVGVDIDFSARNGRPVHPNDPSFFASCEELSRTNNRVPICLGVYRTQADSPEKWLGSIQFTNLAASIAIPDVDPIPRRLPRWVGPEGAGKDREKRLPGFSVALTVSQDRLRITQQPDWAKALTGWLEDHQWLEDSKFKRLKDGTETIEFLVNVNWLNNLKEVPPRKSREFMEDDLDSRQAFCRGQIVLLGDASRGGGTDLFVVPGHEEPVPGVLLHACGVSTLLKGAPLQELTGSGEFNFDLGGVVVSSVLVNIIAWLSLIIIAWLSSKTERDSTGDRKRPVEESQTAAAATGRTDPPPPQKEQGASDVSSKLEWGMTGVTVAVSLVVGFFFVAYTRVIWNDLIIFAIAVPLQTWLVKRVPKLLKRPGDGTTNEAH